MCIGTKDTNLSQTVQLEFTFSTREKNIALLIRRCWYLSIRVLMQRIKGEEITNLMSCNTQQVWGTFPYNHKTGLQQKVSIMNNQV